MEEKLKFAVEALQSALNIGFFEDYVYGTAEYAVKVRDYNGFIVTDRRFTLLAMYEYYKNNPSSNIDKMFYDVLMKSIIEYDGELAIKTVLELISLQLKYERENVATFSIDSRKLFDKFKEVLNANKGLYQNPDPEYDNKPFWETIEEYDDKFKQDFGRGIL